MQSVIDRSPPSTTGARPGGGGDGWVLIFRARNDIEAHLFAGLLAESGIETRSIKDRSTGDAWLNNGSDPWTPVDVWVRGHQVEEARLVLAEIAYDQPAREPELTDGRDWRLPVVWWAVAIALALTLTGISLAHTADVMRQVVDNETSTR